MEDLRLRASCDGRPMNSEVTGDTHFSMEIWLLMRIQQTSLDGEIEEETEGDAIAFIFRSTSPALNSRYRFWWTLAPATPGDTTETATQNA
jgi:hypothetical protein